MTERKAWWCPSCMAHHAPHVETCPGTNDPWGLRLLPQFTPTHLQPNHDPCAGCKGPCGNVACPKLPRVTCTPTGGSVTCISDPNMMVIN